MGLYDQTLYLRNFSATYPDLAIEVYAVDPGAESDAPVMPTYSVTTTDAPKAVPWPRSPINSDCNEFYVATNDGSGPQNIKPHTGSGPTGIQVRLMDEGIGNLEWHFIG